MTVITPVPIPAIRGAEPLVYQASSTWGHLFSHRQGANGSFEIIDWWPQASIGALFSCGAGTSTSHTNVCAQVSGQTVKKVLIGLSYWADDRVTTFNPSSFSGCAASAVSGGPSGAVSALCSTSSFNSYNCMSAVLSSLDSSTGMGTSGSFTFEPGIQTRLAMTGDTNRSLTRSYMNIVVDSPFGPSNEYVNDPNMMRNFLNEINIIANSGGWDYSHNVLTTPNPNFNSTLGIPFWDTNMIC